MKPRSLVSTSSALKAKVWAKGRDEMEWTDTGLRSEQIHVQPPLSGLAEWSRLNVSTSICLSVSASEAPTDVTWSLA